MTVKKVLIALLLLAALGVSSTAQDVSDSALLQAMDEARFLSSTSFTITVEVVADRPDGSNQALVQLFFKQKDGQSLSRIEFLQPEDMAGEVFVSGPEGTFLWNPDLIGPLKTSGRQAVFGDASVAETVGIRFSGHYTVASRQATTLDDGSAALEVKLVATAPDVAFQSATVVVDSQAFRPLKMRLFALGGDPINDVTFERYDDLDGDTFAAKQLIESQFIKANKTLLTITSIAAKELSDDLFDPSKLGQ